MRFSEKQKRTRMAQDGRTETDPPRSTGASPDACPIPGLAHLFEKMDAGQVPNWLEVMSAISDMVAFNTDCDQPSECSTENDFCRSQK